MKVIIHGGFFSESATNQETKKAKLKADQAKQAADKEKENVVAAAAKKLEQEKIKQEVEQAKKEAEKAKQEAEQAKKEAEKVKQEAQEKAQQAAAIAKKLEEEITTLMQDEDVTKKSGIYEFVLTRNEKYLSIRAFTDKQKREAFERQKGICVKCGVEFEINEMEADHITPWHLGGHSTSANCQMLCKHDNRIKSGI